MLRRRLRLRSVPGAFEEDGWDDLGFLLRLDAEKLRGVAKGVGMKPGHAQKFEMYCNVPDLERARERSG